MSAFVLVFLQECQCSVLPYSYLISFKTSSTLTFEKLKLCGLNAILIADTLGLLQNFIIAFKSG